MRKTICKSILIVFLAVFVSCGSRTTQTKKSTEINNEITEKIENFQSETTEKKEAVSEKGTAVVQGQEQTNARQSTENQNRQTLETEKNTTYYPNGQKKSETERTRSLNETIQKQELEIDYLKSSILALTEERDTLKEELAKAEQAEKKEMVKVKEVVKIKEKDTDKNDYLGFLLPIVLVVLGFSLWELWKIRKKP